MFLNYELYSNFYDVMFFISEKKNIDYVIQFMKITSNSTHNAQQRQKA